MMIITPKELAEADLVLIADKEGRFRWSSNHPAHVVAKFLADAAEDIVDQEAERLGL